MKILIPTTKNDLNGEIDSRFARAPYFIIYDTAKKTTEIKENTYKDSARAAGTMFAQYIINEGIKIVIASDMGPNAKMVLTETGIEIKKISGSVKEALSQFK
jgi:predicted Fe-Mo cluster-binding NifX family protein